MPTFKRHQLNLFDAADQTKNFSIGHNSGVVTLTVPAQQYLTVSGKATFSGDNTCVIRTDSEGVQSTHSLESLFDGIDSGLDTLTADLLSEVTRATNSETVLDTKIDSEIAALRATDASNHAASLAQIAAEVARAQQAEAALQVNVDNEQARAEAAELAINNTVAALAAIEAANHADHQSQIDNEVARATASEAAIQADVDANEVAAAAALAAAQATLQNNIDATNAALNNEVTRATGAESGLQGQIDNIVSNVDPAALDSLSEIVAHFSAADSDTTNVLGLLVTRVVQVENVLNCLLDPDLDAMSATLTGAAVAPSEPEP